MIYRRVFNGGDSVRFGIWVHVEGLSSFSVPKPKDMLLFFMKSEVWSQRVVDSIRAASCLLSQGILDSGIPDLVTLGFHLCLLQMTSLLLVPSSTDFQRAVQVRSSQDEETGFLPEKGGGTRTQYTGSSMF